MFRFVLCSIALLAIVPLSAQPVSEEAVQAMAQRIRNRIVLLDNYGVFDSVRFTIRNDVLTMKGQATRPTLKSSAERVVRNIEGVEDVVNEIDVLPLSRLDEQIRVDVYLRVYGHPTLSRYNPNRGTPLPAFGRRVAQGISTDPPRGNHPIHIVVENGNVTLEGVVDNEGDKNIAGILVNGAPNVFKVTNNLVVAKDR